MSGKRAYRQREPVAAALDLIGDRWTLLVIRELVLGPCRWTDLVNNLPGIGKNLLAERVRELTDAGLVRHAALPWSSTQTRMYQLTEAAYALERIVLDLAAFGVARIGPDGEVRPAWAALALAAAAELGDGDIAHAVIDGMPFTFRAEGGQTQVRRGLLGSPTLSVETSAEDVLRGASRILSTR